MGEKIILCLVYVTTMFKVLPALCVSTAFNYCFDNNNKKPTSNVELQQQAENRARCLRDCIDARHPRTVFYNEVTKTCFCTKGDVSTLGLTEDTGGICMELMGYTETWMTSVLGVSSEFNAPSDKRFLATKLLGAPDVYPNAGDLAGTWCANVVDDNQWIEVGISEALYIYHVYIYETYNPGGLKTLSVRDTSNNWQVLWTSPLIQDIPGARIFDPVFQTPAFRVNGFRLDVVMSVAGTWVQYDAIKVVGRK